MHQCSKNAKSGNIVELGGEATCFLKGRTNAGSSAGSGDEVRDRRRVVSLSMSSPPADRCRCTCFPGPTHRIRGVSSIREWDLVGRFQDVRFLFGFLVNLQIND